MKTLTALSHARRIAFEALNNIDFSTVYEDELLADATEEEWKLVHEFIFDRIANEVGAN